MFRKSTLIRIVMPVVFLAVSCNTISNVATQAIGVIGTAIPILPVPQPSQTPTPSRVTLIPVHPELDLPFYHPEPLEGSVARLGTGAIRGVAVNKDWTRTAFGLNKNLIFCDKETCRKISDLEWISELVFSDDGKMAASIGDFLSLWDVEAGQQVYSAPVNIWDAVVLFSPDGSKLAYVEQSKIVLLDGHTGDGIGELYAPGESDSFTSMAFSPDGALLASGTREGGAILVWDIASRKLAYSIPTGQSSVYQVAFSPDGSQLASGSPSEGQGLLQVWDTAAKQEIFSLKDLDMLPYQILYSSDGKLLAFTTWSVSVLDTASWTGKFTKPGSLSNRLFFSKDNTMLANFSLDGDITIFDSRSGSLMESGHSFPGIIGSVEDLDFSPDGRNIVSASASVIIWDAANYSYKATWDTAAEDEFWFNAIAYSPDGKMVAAGSLFGSITLYNASDGKRLLDLTGQTECIYSLDFSPDGSKLASGSGDGSLMVWDTASGAKLWSLAKSDEDYMGVMGVAFSPDGKTIGASFSDKRILLLNAADGSVLNTLIDESKEEDSEFHYCYYYSVAFSPDGKTIAALTPACDIGLWDPASGKSLGEIGLDEDFYSFVMASDGQTFAASTRDADGKFSIAVFRWISSEPAHLFKGFDFYTIGMAFSPDGKTLISGSADGTIIVWDMSLVPSG